MKTKTKEIKKAFSVTRYNLLCFEFEFVYEIGKLSLKISEKYLKKKIISIACLLCLKFKLKKKKIKKNYMQGDLK